MQQPKIYPGEKLNDREKAALATDNEKLTRDAQQRAAEQQEQDRRSGRGAPVVQTVADSLKDRLQKGDFTKR